jgi:hypothetical protein
VYVTLVVQLADAPVPVRAQVPVNEPPVNGLTLNVTLPVGVVGVADVSVTVAVQVVKLPTTRVVG